MSRVFVWGKEKMTVNSGQITVDSHYGCQLSSVNCQPAFNMVSIEILVSLHKILKTKTTG